tara:strand:- start:2579 stop:3133 length:555 start_codon:yes stop_codon:yes gene_type:complete
MIAFIGLGNIGDKYAQTKHNAGFWVLDEFIRRKKLSYKPGNGDYIYAKLQQKEVLLVKPTTGMNKSGNAVKDLANKKNILPQEIHIIVDDIDLPLGSVRIRPKGGDGCHRGLENIIYQLQSNQFPRIRLGIATDEEIRPAEKYVLKPFKKDKKQDVLEMINRGADILENILVHGINHTMNHFNS